MAFNTINVACDFSEVDNLGSDIPIALLVKYAQTREDMMAHRRQFQAARRQGRYAPLLLPLREDKWRGSFIAITTMGCLEKPESYVWSRQGDEVRGYAVRGDIAVIAHANDLLVVEAATGRELRTLRRPEFRNLHSVEFSPDGGLRVLVSNTGLDSIVELDIATGEIGWEWHAWSHGHGHNPHGLRLLRQGRDQPEPGMRVLSPEAAKELMRKDEPVPPGETWAVAVDTDAVDHPLGLEKWLKSAEPNWAGYAGTRDTILATFFVANQLVSVDRASGRTTVLVDALSRPHAAPGYHGGYALSDTRKGRVILLNADLEIDRVFDFSGFPPPADTEIDVGEWLQFTSPIGQGAFLATVDSRRATVFVWHPERRVYGRFPFDPTWSVQSVLDCA